MSLGILDQSAQSTLRKTLADPREFIPRLKIIDQQGVLRKFSEPHPEQRILLDALMRYREIYIVKPRQIGCSTLVRAFDFWYGYGCRDPIRSLVVSHEGDSTDRMHRMNTEFHSSLPRELQRPIDRSNRKELTFADTGAAFRCQTAGSPSGGKSWTYQRIHATEVGSWKENCDAHKVWASINATLHPGPHYQVIVESTGHGPGDLFHDLIKGAMRSDTAAVLFFKWSDHPAYRIDPPPSFEPTLNEEDLANVHGLDLAQLYWRRKKLESGFTLDEFRQHYPLTIEDAFLAGSNGYFNSDMLNSRLSLVTDQNVVTHRNLKIFEQPKKELHYAVGIDSASGRGGDYAVIQVVSQDHKQVAVYCCKKTTPWELAEKAAEIGLMYNKALILAESNNQGGTCLFRLRQLGYPNLWCDPETGKDWMTLTNTKHKAYGWARNLIDGDAVELNDPQTIQELMHVRQTERKIEGTDGYHDDLADAFVLAVWAVRSLPSTYRMSPVRRLAMQIRQKRMNAHPF